MEENQFVSFYFDAFIPQATIGNPQGIISSIDLFEGDNRGFEYRGSYRARQTFSVDLLAEDPQLIALDQDTGETIGLDSDGNEVARDKANTNGFDVDVDREGESIKIEADVRVGNPLVSLSPNIDYDYELSVSVSDKQLNWELTGDHDGFPAYSVYIGEELIYGHDPIAENQTAFSLFPPAEFSVNESGVIDLSSELDVIFLQDLSGSFRDDDLPVLKSLASPLVDTLLEENSDTQFGVASFIDQPIDPFGAPGDYTYRTDLPITDSKDNLISTINSLSTGNGGDDPEAQLTALVEVATRTEELGYRDGSTRYVFLSTDASFQEGGDYPNVEQVKIALEENNVVPIFLVTSDVIGIYQGLANDLGRGEVVTLSSDSSNVTDAVRQAFAEIDGEVTTSGTDEDDTLTGTDEDDGIFGGLGDDTIDGASGDDVLDGGGGDDELSGSEGDDELIGGTGLDVLDGGSGSDLIEGGLDADTLTGSEAADIFSGTLDELNDDVILDFTEEDRIAVKDASFTEDDLTVTEGSAILDIDADSDGTSDATITLEGDFSEFDFVVDSESSEGIANTIIAIEQSESPSENVIEGTDENDSLIGSDRNDVLFGYGGNDVLEGLDGEDELDGGMGNDSLEGGQQNDSLYGRDGEDTLRGSGGADELFGGDGNDELKGSSGDDRAFGEAGNDILYGGSNNDELFGDDDDDTLFGGLGSDSLDGGSGNDRLLGVNSDTDELFGRSTIDTLTGGSGSNTFVLGEGENDVFYDSGIPDNLGTSDYALITDFQLEQDSLELAGSRSDYSFGLTFDDLPTGLAVYHQPGSGDRELIAVLQSDNLLATSEDIENAKAALEIDNFVDSSLEI